MYLYFKGSAYTPVIKPVSVNELVIFLGNEFHKEIVIRTKEHRKKFVWAKGW